MHTYLAVGDVKDVTVEGLDGARYFDKVRGRFATQVGDVAFVGPTYRLTGDVRADMDVIRAFYADKVGVNPAKTSVPRLRAEVEDQ